MTLDLDEGLVRQALRETGAKTKTEVLEMGLRELLEKPGRLRFRSLQGRLSNLDKV